MDISTPVYLCEFGHQHFNISQTNLKHPANKADVSYSHPMRKNTWRSFKISKKNFVSLILGTVGGILFALGMCMAMIAEWGAFKQGIVVGCAGLVVLLIMLAVRRKMEGKPILVPLSAKTVGTAVLGVVGAITLGVGMCLVMVWNNLVWGIAVGLVGIVLLLCLIPLVKGIK